MSTEAQKRAVSASKERLKEAGGSVIACLSLSPDATQILARKQQETGLSRTKIIEGLIKQLKVNI